LADDGRQTTDDGRRTRLRPRATPWHATDPASPKGYPGFVGGYAEASALARAGFAPLLFITGCDYISSQNRGISMIRILYANDFRFDLLPALV